MSSAEFWQPLLVNIVFLHMSVEYLAGVADSKPPRFASSCSQMTVTVFSFSRVAISK
jgi:hypothetical protein